MRIHTIDQQQVLIRPLENSDLPALKDYLNGLSPDTKARFGPHGFSQEEIELFFEDKSIHAIIAQNLADEELIAYTPYKLGFLEHDQARLENYGIHLQANKDLTYAPSVTDRWQSKGLGNHLISYLLSEAEKSHRNRIILWGGVQKGNKKAVKFYLKYGFRILGEFEYHGRNFDMVREL